MQNMSNKNSTCLPVRGCRLNDIIVWPVYLFILFIHTVVHSLRMIDDNFYRASICEGGLGSHNSVRLSVRPSVCLSVTCDACIVTKLNDALQIFYTTRKGNHSVTLLPRVVGRRRPLPYKICVQSDPPPSKNADFDRFPLITSQP